MGFICFGVGVGLPFAFFCVTVSTFSKYKYTHLSSSKVLMWDDGISILCIWVVTLLMWVDVIGRET